ncbi:MAG: TRAM domain-containing protein [Bdellovibrionota bacterium]
MHQPGDILITTIESLAFQGHGIAKPDGFTIFVPRTTPGDKVEIEITQNKKSFAFAKCKNSS